MSRSVSRSLLAFALAAASLAGFATPSAADHLPETYGYEVTEGSSAGAIGAVTATIDGDNVAITANVDGLDVESVVMHFHDGGTCDAGGPIAINVPTNATPQATEDGTLRLSTVEAIGSADLENVYFNIHEAGNLGNVVACATLADSVVTEYTQAAGSASSLLVTNTIVGTTVQTQVSASGLSVPNVVMHFHAGSTCDAMGAIVLGVGGDGVPVDAGTLDETFLAAQPVGLDDPAAVYFNVHDGADLSNVLACGIYTTFLAKAATLDDIITASDYDLDTDPEILRLYQAFFNREPDVGGAIYWIQQRDSFSALAIAGAFPSSSAEFRNTYADAADNEEFLTRVYNNILDREPDAEGFTYWLDILEGTNVSGSNAALAQGSRGTVVFYVAINDEFVNNFPYAP